MLFLPGNEFSSSFPCNNGSGTVYIQQPYGRTTCHINGSVLFIHRQTVSFYSPPAQIRKWKKTLWRNHFLTSRMLRTRLFSLPFSLKWQCMVIFLNLVIKMPHRKWCHNCISCDTATVNIPSPVQLANVQVMHHFNRAKLYIYCNILWICKIY